MTSFRFFRSHVKRRHDMKSALRRFKGKADRNEALDLQVYNLAMAYYLGLHRYGEQDWEKLRQALAQANLFEEPTPAKPPAIEQEDDDADAEVESQSPALCASVCA